MTSTNGMAQFTVGGSGTIAYVAGGTALGAASSSGSIGGGDRMEPTAPRTLFEGRFRLSFGESGGNYDVSPDGRFLMVRAKDLVTPVVIHVVFDWPEALEGSSRLLE